ncbi:hypothetical protein GIB67_027893 [Kingdonia uniflora]|uniref:Tr-type G domain-containing protein n=1 Tax=Kingdonia uniflora TaxID=39325 RepID=A0A7J7LGF3_9MAGN|nr:hypothetical protein GIB67_027893 [Kingdonia uniflora]
MSMKGEIIVHKGKVIKYYRPINPLESTIRSPIVCITGHQDAGKTKLLNFIVGNSDGNVHGATQEIGSTYVSSASVLCDTAVLVVDIMEVLKSQAIESMNLLKLRNTEFIIALNKITCSSAPIEKAVKQQSKDVKDEFKTRLTQIVKQFEEQGVLSCTLKRRGTGKTFCIVPPCAVRPSQHTLHNIMCCDALRGVAINCVAIVLLRIRGVASGEGIPDLLLLLVQWTQKTMAKEGVRKEVQGTVLKVMVTIPLGTTVEVLLSRGVLHVGDVIVLWGKYGTIITKVHTLLTPQPVKEFTMKALHLKGSYCHHKELKASQSIIITAEGLENAIPGSHLHMVRRGIPMDLGSILGNEFTQRWEGVCLQVSYTKSVEEVFYLCRSPEVNIHIGHVSIGPVNERVVMMVNGNIKKKYDTSFPFYDNIIMQNVKFENQKRIRWDLVKVSPIFARKEFATILALDVSVTPEALNLADEVGVKICDSDSICDLINQYKKHVEELKVGTPLCIPSKDFIIIGRISSMHMVSLDICEAKEGAEITITISRTKFENQTEIYGRDINVDDELISHITRKSIDALVRNFKVVDTRLRLAPASAHSFTNCPGAKQR